LVADSRHTVGQGDIVHGVASGVALVQ
jgi:hypothetical protein